MKRILMIGMLIVGLTGCNAAPDGAGRTGSGQPDASSAAGGKPAGAYDPAVDPQSLLAPVRAFVDAVAAKDADKLTQTFADNGVVIDVSRRIEGHDAIRTWARNETITGTLTVLRVVEANSDRQRLLVKFAPGGSGGFQAHYTFSTAGGQITELNMQYA